MSKTDADSTPAAAAEHLQSLALMEKKALAVLRTLTDADARLEKQLRACWVEDGKHDQARSGFFHQYQVSWQGNPEALIQSCLKSRSSAGAAASSLLGED